MTAPEFASLRAAWVALPGEVRDRRAALVNATWSVWRELAPDRARDNCMAATLALVGTLEAAGVAAFPVPVVLNVYDLDGLRVRVGTPEPGLHGDTHWTGHLVAAVPDWSALVDMTAEQANQAGTHLTGPLLVSTTGLPAPGVSGVVANGRHAACYEVIEDNQSWRSCLGAVGVSEYIANGARIADRVADRLLRGEHLPAA